MPEPFDELIELPSEVAGSPVAPGEIVQGKYRIGDAVGIGGMAAVVAAHHLELDQPVAIKFLLPEHAARPDAVRRFLGEARAAARLKSDHVARVLDVGTAETKSGAIVPFMVMELLHGHDLDGILGQRGRLPVTEAVEYILQACDAVAEAHALGIIHRDLKPGNLFLTTRRDGTGVVKLLDFGISKIAPRGQSKDRVAVTADREMMGSPGYMSPEQIRSAKDVDVRTDVWALGTILHELLTGRAPFSAENIADTLVRVLHSAPDPIADLAPEVPAGLVDVVTRCLQKRPEHRYANVEELVAALAPYRSHTRLVVPPFVARTELGAVSDAGVSVRTVHALPKRRLLLTGLLAVGAVGLVLIAAAGFAKLRGASTRATTPSSATMAAPFPGEETNVSPAMATALSSAAPGSAVPPTSGAAPSAPSAHAADEPPAEPANAAADARTTKPIATVAKPGPGTKPRAVKPVESATTPRHRTDW